MHPGTLSFAFAACLLACETPKAESPGPVDSPPELAGPAPIASSPPTAEPSAGKSLAHDPEPTPGATAPEGPAAAPKLSAPATAPGRTCLMYQVCGCNHGCSAVAVAPNALREGLALQVVAGAAKGKQAFVARAAEAGGGETLVLTRDAPGSPMLCDRRAAASLIGYGCQASKLGPVPRDACADSCADLR